MLFAGKTLNQRDLCLLVNLLDFFQTLLELLRQGLFVRERKRAISCGISFLVDFIYINTDLIIFQCKIRLISRPLALKYNLFRERRMIFVFDTERIQKICDIQLLVGVQTFPFQRNGRIQRDIFLVFTVILKLKCRMARHVKFQVVIDQAASIGRFGLLLRKKASEHFRQAFFAGSFLLGGRRRHAALRQNVAREGSKAAQIAAPQEHKLIALPQPAAFEIFRLCFQRR